MRSVTLASCFLAAVLTTHLASAKDLHLDLAQSKSITKTISPGTYRLKILNTLPKADYQFEAVVKRDEIPPLNLEDLLESAKTPDPVEAERCEELTQALQDLAAAVSEDQVAVVRRKVESAMAKKDCAEADARELLALMERDVGEIFLQQGDALHVTVTRKNAQGAVLTWNGVFETGERGRWLTSYGISFLPNRDEHYFSKASTDGTFAIVRKEDREVADALPSVLIHWRSASHYGKNWSFSPTGLVGVDFEQPALGVGLSTSFNENLTASVGVALHEQKRLAGKYDTTTTLKEQLDSSQLEEETYAPNIFFAIGLRLTKNIFKPEE